MLRMPQIKDYRYYCHFADLEFIQLPGRATWSYLAYRRKDEEKVEFPRQTTSLKIITEKMIGNVLISEVDAIMYVVLSEAEKTL